MAKADVLARVRADLAAGHTHMAIQRLRTLLATLSDDVEVRSLLAAVYRRHDEYVREFGGEPFPQGRDQWVFSRLAD